MGNIILFWDFYSELELKCQAKYCSIIISILIGKIYKKKKNKKQIFF